MSSPTKHATNLALALVVLLVAAGCGGTQARRLSQASSDAQAVDEPFNSSDFLFLEGFIESNSSDYNSTSTDNVTIVDGNLTYVEDGSDSDSDSYDNSTANSTAPDYTGTGLVSLNGTLGDGNATGNGSSSVLVVIGTIIDQATANITDGNSSDYSGDSGTASTGFFDALLNAINSVLGLFNL